MMDSFTKEKSDFLGKKDKSKKGSIDKEIIPLIREINSKDNYYTTSSCAGRIVLLEMMSRKKNECSWMLAKHDKVKFIEVKIALYRSSMKNISNAGKNNDAKNINETKKLNSRTKTKTYEVWLKQQPLILHVACRDLNAAKKLLETARRIFKKAGIIGLTDRKVTVEVIGSEHLETIVKDGNFEADERYLKELVKHANIKFVENRKKTVKFYELLSKI